MMTFQQEATKILELYSNHCTGMGQGIFYTESIDRDKALSLLTAIHKAEVERIIGEDEKLKILDTFRDHKVMRNALRHEQRAKLTTNTGGQDG